MNESACTTILVGKKASIDGSTMIARNDDTFLPLTPQRFVMQPAVSGRKETLESNMNGFKAPLPESGYKTTFTLTWKLTNGVSLMKHRSTKKMLRCLQLNQFMVMSVHLLMIHG